MRCMLPVLALAALSSARLLPGTNTTAFECSVSVKQAPASYLSVIKDLQKSNGSTIAVTVNATAPETKVARTFSQIARLFTRQKKPTALVRIVIPKSFEVPTYFHVLSSANNAGLVTQQMLNEQLTVLNRAYASSQIRFRLVETTRTVRDTWAAGQDMDNLKRTLRKGNYSSLNLYFHTDMSGGILGTCTLPTNIGNSKAFSWDGCSMAAQTMPGGSITGYNLGYTAVHEVGHWLGLLHVFEGYSCSGSGDFISDTPLQSTSTDGCPKKKNSCSAQPGDDSIHNYMDYSTDACYERFTNGQITRMKTLWAQFRVGK